MMILFLEQVFFPNLLSSDKPDTLKGQISVCITRVGEKRQYPVVEEKGSRICLTLAGVGGNEVCSKHSLDTLSPA